MRASSQTSANCCRVLLNRCASDVYKIVRAKGCMPHSGNTDALTGGLVPFTRGVKMVAMTDVAKSDVTLLLQAIGHDKNAPGRLLSAVYEELRAMARNRL